MSACGATRRLLRRPTERHICGLGADHAGTHRCYRGGCGFRWPRS